MTIKEAQEISRTHGISNCGDARKGNVMLYLSAEQYNAICAIEAALDNGYQLCKVEDVIKTIKECSHQERTANGMIDRFIQAQEAVDCIRDACE